MVLTSEITASQLITIIGSFLGLIAIIGAAFVVMRSTLSSTTNSLWEKNAAALTERVEILEQTEAECRRDLAALKEVNKILSDQVTGASAISMLGSKLDKQFSDLYSLLGGSRKSDR